MRNPIWTAAVDDDGDDEDEFPVMDEYLPYAYHMLRNVSKYAMQCWTRLHEAMVVESSYKKTKGGYTENVDNDVYVYDRANEHLILSCK